MGKTGLKAYNYRGFFIPVLKHSAVVWFILVSSCFLTVSPLTAQSHLYPNYQNPTEIRILLNGRIWRNQYSRAYGDPFFMANEYIKGSVTFNGQKFDNLDLKFDIANDDLILNVESHPTIMVNKEMVDSFNLIFENKSYHIINSGNDTSGILKGYVNVLYDGPTTLYVKYTKKLQPLAVDGRYDLFYQEHRIYLKRGNDIIPISGKIMLLKLLEDKKKEIRNFLKSRKLKITRKDPDTFIPVLMFYDTISK